MAAQVSFWQRVGNILRLDRGRSNTLGSEPRTAPEDDAGVSAPLAPGPGRAGWLGRDSRADQAREMSLRMSQLAEALQEHFRRQEEQSAQLVAPLRRVGQTLDQLAAAQQSQSEYLRTIADRAEAAGKHAANLGTALGRVPDALATQAEAVRSVARQLEISQEADTQLMHALQQFSRAVDGLSSAGTAQADVLQRLHSAQQEQHAAWQALVKQQSRRFAMVLVLIAVLVISGMATLIIVLPRLAGP